jgi:hypothetical protein
MAGLLSFSGRVDAPGENFRGNALWQLGHIECPRLCPTSEEQRVSIQYDSARARFVVRWREDGKHRTRRFDDEADAVAFDAHVNPGGRSAQRSRASRASIDARVSKLEARRAATDRQDGVYPYATNDGVRWRFVFRQSDGSLSSRRDFTSRTAATAARRKVVESVDRRELTVCRETFASFWDRFASRPHHPRTQAPDPILRRPPAGEDRRGARPRLARNDDRARRGGRARAQDRQQRSHVVVRRTQRSRAPAAVAAQPVC